MTKQHDHQPAIPTRPKSVANLCRRCGKIIKHEALTGLWKEA